ncbi:MAG: hypothetical protein KDD98_01310 [Sphingomonadaceae bacterium]|nr:hypothetical protein [Sphingomonadaceae bacterium]
MMLAEEYRLSAQAQRQMAIAASLPRLRDQHMRAADRWDFLADEAEALQAGVKAMFEPVASERGRHRY